MRGQLLHHDGLKLRAVLCITGTDVECREQVSFRDKILTGSILSVDFPDTLFYIAVVFSFILTIAQKRCAHQHQGIELRRTERMVDNGMVQIV